MSSRLTPTLSQEPTSAPDGSPEAGTQPAEEPFAEAGRRLGRYVVLRQIGEGSMGVVYSAYDELLARRVALKLVRTDAGGSAAHTRILREAQALARLSHPHVVQIYEVSAAAGRVFLAMEHVEGDTLRAWMEARRAAGAGLRELLDMYIQAGRGLAAAHAAGLVHRDFKPDNVLVGVDGRARVVDFGLVAAPAGTGEGAGGPTLTAAGLLGTPAYMSPEQFAGCTADARSDQFSFCVAVHEAVCGARPFAGEGVEALRAAVVTGAPAEPPAGIPAWLWALLRRGLAPDPAERFASMEALLAGLARDPAELRRRRLRVAGLVVLSGVIAVLAALLVQDVRQGWLRRGREEAATRAEGAMESRVAAARADGDPAAAEQLFAAFVGDPAHEGTDAVARAWLAEAGRRAADGARDEARAAFATAYLTAPADALQSEALVGLVRHFHGGAESAEFAQAFALLERRHPEAAYGPVLADMRVEAALARRDLVDARAASAGAATPIHRLARALDGAAPTVHRGIEEVVVHAGHALLRERSGGRQTLHLARADATLTPVRSFPLPDEVVRVTIARADPFLAVVDIAYDNRLVRVDEGGMTTLATWPDAGAFALAAADLDGDGARELYIGAGAANGIDVARPDADGVWIRENVYTDREALRSAVHGLAALDLDGDGREELVATLDGWHAFDVRVLRRGPGSARLELVARDKPGTSRGLTGVRVDGVPLLAVHHAQHAGSTLVFPPGRERGDPSGVIFYAFAGAELVRRAHLPMTNDRQGLWVGDVDGDGRDDLGVGDEQDAPEPALLHMQGDDGAFTQVVVGELRLLALAQLDGDAAHELVGAIEDGDGPLRVWTLGAGAGELPPVAAAPSGEAALVDPDDPTWTRQAADAAALADLGLHTDAGAAFEALGRRAAGPDLRGGALLRAATLYERAQRHRDAARLYRAATSSSAAAAAYRGLLRSQLRVGAYDDAGATLTAALAAPDLPADARAELMGHGLAEGLGERVDLDLREPLAPAWELPDARALRREPDGLAIATQAPGVLLSLPVALSGDLLELNVDISLRQFEWSADLEIGLAPEDDPRGELAAAVRIQASGTSRGGYIVSRHHSCAVSGQPLRGHQPNDGVPITDEPLRVDMRVAFAAILGEVACETRVHASPRGRYLHRRDIPLPPAGRHRLVVRLHNDVPAWVDMTIHRIGLRGATVRREPPADPRRAALQRAVLARDPEATLATYATIADPTARERVWQADTLVQLGRRAEADAALAGLLAGPLSPDLASRLRGEPAAIGPHLNALDPAGQPGRLVAVWRNTAVNHLGDPQARRAMGAALAGLDVDAALALARDDDARGEVAELLGHRARLWTYAGEPERARRELERALEIVATLAPGAAPRVSAWELWIELATLAAAAGDHEGAREAVRRARASSDMPMLVDDVVRARPALALPVE